MQVQLIPLGVFLWSSNGNSRSMFCVCVCGVVCVCVCVWCTEARSGSKLCVALVRLCEWSRGEERWSRVNSPLPSSHLPFPAWTRASSAGRRRGCGDVTTWDGNLFPPLSMLLCLTSRVFCWWLGRWWVFNRAGLCLWGGGGGKQHINNTLEWTSSADHIPMALVIFTSSQYLCIRVFSWRWMKCSFWAARTTLGPPP